MKTINSEDLGNLRKAGKNVKYHSRADKNKEKKPEPKEKSNLGAIVALLKELISKQNPAPVVNFPEAPGRWKFTVSRGENGFIKEIIAEKGK